MISPPKSRTPFADSALAKFLDRRIEALKDMKTEAEIAKEIWSPPSFIPMYRRGEAKFPLDTIWLLAAAIDATPAHLFRLALEQHWPGLGEEMVLAFGAIATPAEEGLLLRPWRKATDNMDPRPIPELERAIARMITEVRTIELPRH